MEFGMALKFLHVVAAVAMVAGLIAREVVLGRARRSNDINQVELLLEVSNPSRRWSSTDLFLSSSLAS